MKRTAEEQRTLEAFREEFPTCWMCLFLGYVKPHFAETHHIAGRGRYHEVRTNYSALCREHHADIQSRTDAELVCLALKWCYDISYYSPATICRLRGRAETCWTNADVIQAKRIMAIMKDC